MLSWVVELPSVRQTLVKISSEDPDRSDGNDGNDGSDGNDGNDIEVAHPSKR